jgi:ribosomal protein S18 acetylase RimI-like enzyme
MIREFKPEDLPTLLVIARKAWKPIFDNYKNQLGAELYPLVYPDPEEPFRIKEREIRAQAEKVPHEILICEREGKIAGFIFFGMRGKTGIICNNAKDPDSAERGVAQEMYAAVLEKFKAAGMTVATVSTGLDCAHAPARRAYEKAGFAAHMDKISYYMKLD